jgi:hypothetical protein
MPRTRIVEDDDDAVEVARPSEQRNAFLIFSMVRCANWSARHEAHEAFEGSLGPCTASGNHNCWLEGKTIAFVEC